MNGDYYRRIISELEGILHNPAFRGWRFEAVANANGLNQEGLVKDLLDLQNDLSSSMIPFTVLDMPLGGRKAGDMLSGKSNVVNCIAEYARTRGSTILGLMDDDVGFRNGNIASDLQLFVREKLNLPRDITGWALSIPRESKWGPS